MKARLILRLYILRSPSVLQFPVSDNLRQKHVKGFDCAYREWVSKKHLLHYAKRMGVSKFVTNTMKESNFRGNL